MPAEIETEGSSLAAIKQHVELVGDIAPLADFPDWTVLLPWLPGFEAPGRSCQLPDNFNNSDRTESFRHTQQLPDRFSTAIDDAAEEDEDDLKWWLPEMLKKACRVVDEDGYEIEETDFVNGFYHDTKSNTGWMSDRERSCSMLIDFDMRCVLTGHKSLCLPENRSRQGDAKVENVVRSPLDGYADVCVREQSCYLTFWFEDYIEGRPGIACIG
ncbi:hypothetical protein N658DRAFT_508826 [Parathielavia hyrcaniae]|uniref:Uncharacterized protein n=1 Tax=Parathielavia hyrcaniae TaxID=113614 RepID=A0AAN6Q1R1_9PEZI|nr:hypothetical protein N658DRAFT_508826 [Parathielavia hyrcaniae]